MKRMECCQRVARAAAGEAVYAGAFVGLFVAQLGVLGVLWPVMMLCHGDEIARGRENIRRYRAGGYAHDLQI